MVLSQATGTAETEAALTMLERVPTARRITVGADKGYDTREFVTRYTTLVHEAGHALGIVEGNTGTGQVRHHPTIKDSVMSYSNDPSVSCSPLPFDILAMHALYQTVD